MTQYVPKNYFEVVDAEEADEADRKKKLWGNAREIINSLAKQQQHLLSHLLTGATRTGKSSTLWGIADIYKALGFKIVVLDLPATEGSNVCEPGFACIPMEKRLRFGTVHPLLQK